MFRRGLSVSPYSPYSAVWGFLVSPKVWFDLRRKCKSTTAHGLAANQGADHMIMIRQNLLNARIPHAVILIHFRCHSPLTSTAPGITTAYYILPFFLPSPPPPLWRTGDARTSAAARLVFALPPMQSGSLCTFSLRCRSWIRSDAAELNLLLLPPLLPSRSAPVTVTGAATAAIKLDIWWTASLSSFLSLSLSLRRPFPNLARSSLPPSLPPPHFVPSCPQEGGGRDGRATS